MLKRIPLNEDERNWALEFVQKTLNKMRTESKYSDDDPAMQELLAYQAELEGLAFEQASPTSQS